MKLWLLRMRFVETNGWVAALLIRARSAEEARVEAQGTAEDAATYPWLDEEASSCVELGPDGPAGLVMNGNAPQLAPLTPGDRVVFDGSPAQRDLAVAMLGTPLADELEAQAKANAGKPNGVYEVSVGSWERTKETTEQK